MSEERRYDLYGQAFAAEAHETYARMRRSDPVLRQPGIDGRTPIWFLTRHQDVERMLRDETSFSRDPERAGVTLVRTPLDDLLFEHMLNKSGDDHRRLRTLVQQAFTPKRVAGLRPYVQDLADALLDAAKANGRMDVVHDYAFPLPIQVIFELLGIPHEDRDRFREWSKAVLTPVLDEEGQAQARRRLEAFTDYLRDLFALRRSDPREDLISDLLRVEAEGDRLSEHELYSTVVLLIVAGHETTGNLIANGVLALHRDEGARSVFERAVRDEDRTTVANAVEELIRFDGPVSRALNRWAVRDARIGDRTIRRGDVVIGIVASANRDEARFERPNVLDPTRDAKAHLGFGKGIHYCLGAPLARLEGEIALASFVRALPGWTLDLPEGGVPAYRAQPGFRSPVSLTARW
ncbi:MAG: cytochrome P450 [Trueperaceae bacterium]